MVGDLTDREFMKLLTGSEKKPMPQQLGRSDLDGMSPEDVAKAKREGRLDVLLGRRRPTADEVLNDDCVNEGNYHNG